ncbi:unnamed protein product [Periconia digitata]|uniref:Uncharacterized protein n=1 Tax=Periconia digitata TaxID=1303443 RepID=A0A9W4UH56_9PLEO|nr:unnamed protein product [Periconia digitata]
MDKVEPVVSFICTKCRVVCDPGDDQNDKTTLYNISVNTPWLTTCVLAIKKKRTFCSSSSLTGKTATMTPPRNGVLVLLSLAASIQAAPASIPSDQISLNPPSYSISWDGPQVPTQKPEEDPIETAAPTPTDQISLDPPSYTVTWDGPEVPTTIITSSTSTQPGYSVNPIPTKKPHWPKPPHSWKPSSSKTKPAETSSSTEYEPIPSDPIEIPDFPEPSSNPPSKPSDSFSLGPPSATISWGKRQGQFEPVPTDCGDPEEPTPEEPTPEEPTPEEPENPPTPPDDITLAPPTATVSWGKRQWPYRPKPTKRPQPTKGPKPTTSLAPEPSEEPTPEEPTPEEPTPEEPIPEEPEEPEEPPSNPSSPPDEVTLAPPTATISWGKRQIRPTPHTKPKPTKSKPTKSSTIKTSTKPTPTQSEEPIPEEPIPEEPTSSPPSPPDEVTLAPPTATVTWGKRQFDDITLVKPTATVGWSRRQDEEGPGLELPGLPELPELPIPTNPDDVTLVQPTATMSWGKRQDEEDPETEQPQLPAPTISDDITLVPPTATVSWGKREAEAAPQTNSWGIVWPTNIPQFPSIPIQTIPGTVSWGKRDPEPTVAAILDDAQDARFTCGSTITTSSIHPCPRPSCQAHCTLSPEFITAPWPSINTETGIPSCPLTATATNVCASCVCPTTIVTSHITTPPPLPTDKPQPPFPCSTVTLTVAPPCVPPTCPHVDDIACKIGNAKPIPVEKVTITTITSAAPSATKPLPPGGECSPRPTTTVHMGCPTFTCVPATKACPVPTGL